MGSAKYCRNSAIRCIEMAKRAASLRLQTTLIELARSWMRLARELESRTAFSERAEDVVVAPTKALTWRLLPQSAKWPKPAPTAILIALERPHKRHPQIARCRGDPHLR